MPLGEYGGAVCDGGERAADFPGVPEFWGEDSAERFAALAASIRDWGVVGWGIAVASDVHVDLHGNGSPLPRLPDFQRELPASAIHAEGYSWRVADGETLFLLR